MWRAVGKVKETRNLVRSKSFCVLSLSLYTISDSSCALDCDCSLDCSYKLHHWQWLQPRLWLRWWAQIEPQWHHSCQGVKKELQSLPIARIFHDKRFTWREIEWALQHRSSTPALDAHRIPVNGRVHPWVNKGRLLSLYNPNSLNRRTFCLFRLGWSRKK